MKLKNYGLPEISKELEESIYNHRIKYFNLYLRLIKRCQLMTQEELSGYNEKHHILPRCLGGKDSKDNLILMPIRYHIVSHLILAEIYPENIKLLYAVNLIFHGTELKQNTVSKYYSSRLISKIKEFNNQSLSGVFSDKEKERRRLLTSGSKNGRARKIISQSGIIYGSLSEASKENNIPYMTITKWLSGEISSHGWRYLEGEKTDFSNRNTENSSKKVKSPDGTIYKSIKDASNLNNIPYTTLRYWLSGRVKENHGWEYYKEEDNTSKSD